MKITSFMSPKPGMKLDTVNDHRFDGHFVGAGGQIYPPDTYWRDVPPVLPDNGKPVWRTVLMVNGIMTDAALQASDMQKMANTGCKVVGVHNATKGMLRDLAQCAGDKWDLKLANNQATETVSKVIHQVLSQNEEPPLLVGHSQGALVVSNALGRVGGESLKKLDVLTMGGASWTFPKGPRYRHYVNVFDAVPMGAGVGAVSWLTCGPEDKIFRFGEVNKPTNLPPLEEDISNYLARVVDRSVHGPQDVYIPKVEGELPPG
ncbi:hypothetical protein JST97_13185 [bacterium]|nr:hypothetical protein [bacterium]